MVDIRIIESTNNGKSLTRETFVNDMNSILEKFHYEILNKENSQLLHYELNKLLEKYKAYKVVKDDIEIKSTVSGDSLMKFVDKNGKSIDRLNDIFIEYWKEV